jgi:fused signal recognition particle receptor
LFEKLKDAFASLTKIVSEKTLSAKELDDALFNFKLSLLESDVGQEVVDSITDTVKKDLLGSKVERAKETGSIVRETLRNAILVVFSSAPPIDIIGLARDKKKTGEPFVILFLGINGTGKTTTVAKFANLLKQKGLSVVVAAGDTHRAGAIEQLTEHANRISAKVIAQRYGADPAAVARCGHHRYGGQDADEPEPDGRDGQDRASRKPRH